MSGTRNSRWLLLALLAAALVVRLAAGVWWQERLPEGTRFAFGDSESYWELGRAIAAGRPYEFGPHRLRVFRTPGYPLLLAGLFQVVGDDPPVIYGRVLSALLGTLAVGCVSGLAWVLFDSRTALIATAIAAVYPGAIALSTFVLSEAPFCPLMLMQLIGWACAWKATDPKQIVSWSLLAGVAAGLATLMRPSWLLFTPFAGVIGIAFADQRGRQLIIVGLMLFGLCLTMSSWWIRNYMVVGRFVPTSLQVGASLYDGLHPAATGGSDMRFVARFEAEQLGADARNPNLPGNFEERLDERMRQASIAWARENPGRVAELIAIKFSRMWSILPNAAEMQGWTIRLALAVTYTPIMILVLIGAWRYARRDWPIALLLLPAVYFTCLHVIFVSSIRYRQPAMLPLIILAAAVLAALWHPRSKDIQRRFVATQ